LTRVSLDWKRVCWFVAIVLVATGCTPTKTNVSTIDAISFSVEDQKKIKVAVFSYFGRQKADLMGRGRTDGFESIVMDPISGSQFKVVYNHSKISAGSMTKNFALAVGKKMNVDLVLFVKIYGPGSSPGWYIQSVYYTLVEVKSGQYIKDSVTTSQRLTRDTVTAVLKEKYFDFMSQFWKVGDLFDAIAKGNLTRINELIDDKESLYLENDRGQTPLFTAVEMNNLEITKLLIQSGADVNHQDEQGSTPLLVAVNNKSLPIAQYLIENGADLNHMNNQGDLPLAEAANSGHLPAVVYLVKKGADINIKNKLGLTPLNYAALNGHSQIVKFLVAQGADKTIADRDGSTPYQYAKDRGYSAIAAYLASDTEVVNVERISQEEFERKLKKQRQEQLVRLEQELAAGEKDLSVKLEQVRSDKLFALEKEIEEARQMKLVASEKELSAELSQVKSQKLSSLDQEIEAARQKKMAEMEAALERHRRLAEEKLKRDQEINKSDLKKWRESEKEKLARETEERENRRHLDVFYENLGKYYALVIGNNKYKDLPNLETASHDAKSVGQILKDKYGFSVNILLDATRSDILLALSDLRESLSKTDNLLVYYAGHGWLDQEGDEGYWLPVDAAQDNQINWISNSSITTSLKAILAKHVIIVADSCYSGKLARGLIHLNNNRTPNYIARISQKRSRTVLASGGIEPVADGGGKGNHSIFASSLLEILEENKDIIDGSELFSKIRRPVMVNSDQSPEYADIRKAGHDGGDFLFVRRD
jgi:ankyrin repeat protein